MTTEARRRRATPFDYVDRLWPDAEGLAAHGDDPALLLARLRAMLAGVEPSDEELVAWLRRDVPPAVDDPAAVYARLASGGSGEAMFASGVAALAATGYGDLAGWVDAAAARRFAGLGCPWVAGLPRVGAAVVDLGCGSGVDVAIAAHAAGPAGTVVGVDCRLDLMPAAAPSVAVRFVLASALDTTLPDACASMVVANGLPPLMSTATAPAALREMQRLLVSGGQLRVVVLATGPDVGVDALDEGMVVNAVRCGKPLCARFRRMLAEAGFGEIALTRLASPFVAGFRPGPVAAILLTATRQ